MFISNTCPRKKSVKVVEFAQGLGANVTAEVAPQHFSKTEALLLTKGSNAKMNPPLRLESDRRAVIEDSSQVSFLSLRQITRLTMLMKRMSRILPKLLQV